MNDELRDQINKLSVSEKILLVEEIWDSLANKEQAFDLTETQKRTVLKRSDELKQNSSIGRPWEGIRDEFLGKNK